MNISIPSRVIFSLGPIPITDAILGALIVSFILVGGSILAARRFALVPTRAQVALEFILGYILEQLENAFGSRERALKFLPLFVTTILFLTFANQVTLLPFMFDILYEGEPLFRQNTSDFAQPLALSIMMVFLANFLALKISPIGHLSSFFPIHLFFKVRSFGDFANACLQFFIGVLNIVGEIAKVVSLAARLFGNIFAGNVMVAVIISLASFTQFLVPIPFIALSIFSGFVQALVFTLLGIQFIAISVKGVEPEPREATA